MDRYEHRSTQRQTRSVAGGPLTGLLRAVAFRCRGLFAPAPAPPSTSGGHDFIQVFETQQNVSRFGAICPPEHARQLELIDDSGCPSVPDAHAPLQQRRRSELILDAHLGGLAEQRVTLSGSLLPAPRSFFAFLLRLLERCNLLVNRGSRSGGGRRRVRLVPLHQPLGLIRRNERALHAHRLAP